MTAPKKYDAILVDTELNSRMRLKQATTSVHNFGQVYQTGTIEEALSKLNTVDNCDVVFISYRFEQEAISKFIKTAKSLKSGQDTAYIQVLKSHSADSSTVALNVIGGADGMLFEPYSVDCLIEITNLAAKVRYDRSSTREKAAIQVVINDLITQIDQLAYLKQSGMDTTRGLKKLAETMGVIKALSPESQAEYYEMCVKAFEAAPVSVNVSKYKKYGGVSERAKKRLEKKVIAEMDKNPTDDSTPKP